MTLEQIELEYETALLAETVARITARNAARDLEDATLKVEQARRAYCEATLTPEQTRFREWHATYTAKEKAKTN